MDPLGIRTQSDDPELFDYVRQALDYDPCTGSLVWVYDMLGIDAHTEAGSTGHKAFSKATYRRIKVAGKNYLAGQIVWFWMTGKLTRRIYFRDSNTFNLIWSNLVTDPPEKPSE